MKAFSYLRFTILYQYKQSYFLYLGINMREQNNFPMLRHVEYTMLLAIIIISTSILRIPIVHAETTTNTMLVHKSPTCGCCNGWVNHIKGAGFNTLVNNAKDLSAIKTRLKIAPKNQACHTAVLQDYVFEGHIPANVIEDFLVHKPKDAIGLTVPGMPMGSPGMDNGKAFNPYMVFQLNKDGSRVAYATISFDKTIYAGQKL
jgi:hypothetical protein